MRNILLMISIGYVFVGLSTKLDSLQKSSKETSRVHDETPSSNDENQLEGQGDQQRGTRASKPSFYGGPAHQEEPTMDRPCHQDAL